MHIPKQFDNLDIVSQVLKTDAARSIVKSKQDHLQSEIGSLVDQYLED